MRVVTTARGATPRRFQVLRHAQRVEGTVGLERAGQCPGARGETLGRCVTLRPCRNTCPGIGRRIPHSKAKNVDFPAPFGPMTQRNSPPGQREIDRVGRDHAAEALVQVPIACTPGSLAMVQTPGVTPGGAGAACPRPQPRANRTHDPPSGANIITATSNHADDHQCVLAAAGRQHVAQLIEQEGADGNGEQAGAAADRDPDHRQCRLLQARTDGVM